MNLTKKELLKILKMKLQNLPIFSKNKYKTLETTFKMIFGHYKSLEQEIKEIKILNLPLRVTKYQMLNLIYFNKRIISIKSHK